MQLIGQILAERYEILAVLGSGGMATVYKGQDLLLNRQVAIKTLKTEFNTDEEFVRKFKQESQAAAKLSHPNIVNVFDVGFNGALHYIVMELVNGHTLKDYISHMNGFMREEAIIKISLQVAAALSEAHHKEIVHRDIKAQNILVNENGSIKVTDFGIARASTSSTIVNTKEIIGSVHYASPEQARGGFVDARSDLYSLGILMYELATKALPFEADTPVTVALKHIKEDMPDPSDINPELSIGLCSIIKKCTQKEPSERYQDAHALMADLNALALNGDFVANGNAGETRVIPKITEEDIMSHRVTQKNQNVGKKGHRLNVTLVVLSALVLTMLIFGIFAVNKFRSIFDVELVEVPMVKGYHTEDAVRMLADVGLIADITEKRFSNEVEENYIISQSYEAGEMLKKGFTVKLVVSNGGMQTLVPNVRQQDLVKARVMLENEGFVVGEITRVDNEFPEGMVIDQSPKGGVRMAKGTVIDLTVSKGPSIQTVIVPSLLDKTIREAEVILNQIGLRLGDIDYEASDTVEKGRIISNDEVGKEVSKGSSVKVLVSLGGSGDATGEDPDEPDEPADPEPPVDPGEAVEMRLTVIIVTSQFENDTERVRVEVIQNDQSQILYDAERSKDEGAELPVPLRVTGKAGKATIRVYYGDKIAQQQEIQF